MRTSLSWFVGYTDIVDNIGLHGLSFDEYSIYTSYPHWRGLRLQVLERSLGKCEVCQSEAVSIHHLYYGNLYAERLECLLAVCRSCHMKEHMTRPTWSFQSCHNYELYLSTNGPPIPARNPNKPKRKSFDPSIPLPKNAKPLHGKQEGSHRLYCHKCHKLMYAYPGESFGLGCVRCEAPFVF